MRYICKKNYHDIFSGLKFKTGDVVKLSFSNYITAARMSDGKSCVMTTDTLNENFTQYDNLPDSDDIRGFIYLILCKDEYSKDGYDKNALVDEMAKLLERYKIHICGN